MHDSYTFREELRATYPTNGYALWDPDPGGLYEGVRVGDVGYIHEGKFIRLFNALDQRDGSEDPLGDMPPMLLPRFSHHVYRGVDNTGHFCSRDVVKASRRPSDEYYASGPIDATQATFSCHGEHGAMLSLPFSAHREDTVARNDFRKWIIRNIDDCFAFSRSLGFGINGMEDIILVTGCHRAKSWISAAFHENSMGCRVSFGMQVSNNNNTVNLKWVDARGATLKLGPQGFNLPENQCLFVRGFRVVRPLKFLPRSLRAMAEPRPDAGGNGEEPEVNIGLEPTNVPADTYEPLHTLMKYLAEQSPDCDMIIVHDDDLAHLACTSGTLIQHLRKRSPEIEQVEYDILPRSKTESGTEITTAKVAMLSQHALEILHTSSGRPVISLIPTAPDYSTSPTLSSPMSTLLSYSNGDEDKIPDSPAKRSPSNLDLSSSYRLWKGTCMVEVSATLEKDVVFGLDPVKHQIG